MFTPYEPYLFYSDAGNYGTENKYSHGVSTDSTALFNRFNYTHNRQFGTTASLMFGRYRCLVAKYEHEPVGVRKFSTHMILTSRLLL